MGLWPNTTNNLTYAKGLMECLYWGDGYGVTGPHVMADLEMGVYEGTNRNASYKGINASFVTAMVKGDSNDHWAIKARALPRCPTPFPSSIRRPPDACPGLQWGDAQQGPLHTAFDGKRPGGVDYNPMKKPGGLVLGLGGDTSNGGVGTVSAAVLSVLLQASTRSTGRSSTKAA